MDPKITIKNTGEVLADGVSVGTVEKVVHDGLWATAYGIRAGGAEWKGTAPDGTVFDGKDKRKDAAKMLVLHAQPLTVSKVSTGDRMGQRFIEATVCWQGHTAMVSRYPGEEAWVVDCFYTPGAFMPAWSNGAGSRYTRAHVLKPDQAAAVDAAVLAAEVTLDAN